MKKQKYLSPQTIAIKVQTTLPVCLSSGTPSGGDEETIPIGGGDDSGSGSGSDEPSTDTSGGIVVQSPRWD